MTAWDSVLPVLYIFEDKEKMKVVYNWLKEFVDVTASPADLRARLSLAGVAVDSIEESAAGPVLDAEVTANRPDCLGHLGIAREVAAIYRLPLKPLHPKLKESAEKVADATRVEIAAPDLCGRFTARVLRGVKVQPSPDWLRQGLGSDRRKIHQQCGGRHQLRDVRAGPPSARFRFR